MSTSEEHTGRYRQRRRTRAAIVTATTALLRDGATPSVAEIAEAADVSRRTVYLYFPTLEQLLIDATIQAMPGTEAIDAAIDAADPGGDAQARVVAMVDAISVQTAESLPLGRSLIRLTVDAPPGAPGMPKRGYRRVDWIERATEPLRAELADAQYERLVSGLTMVIGWEAMIVLQDLRALPPDELRATMSSAARALIAAALTDARTGS